MAWFVYVREVNNIEAGSLDTDNIPTGSLLVYVLLSNN